VRGEDDRPLRSDKVTFGGWRQGPWYMLDATHPEARAYLENVFRTLRSWGCTYFKLDANLWGAFPAGRRHDPQATSVEAYRLGMDAIRRGAGPDSLLLACNQAYWPSLGTVHASRTSFDIGRDPKTFRRVARQNLLRNWMNDRLWWNDPDCLLIPDVTPSATGFDPGPTFASQTKITPEHFSFHAAATYASGGMILSGDAVADYSPAQWNILHRALARPPVAARFADDHLEVGVIDEPTRRVVVLLNWDDTPVTRRIPVADRFADTPVRITDFWTDHVVSAEVRNHTELTLPPGGGRVLVLETTLTAPER
jgi:alpha-galactosidase